MVCPCCNIFVAKFDPEKVKHAGNEYHGACYRRQKRVSKPAKLNAKPRQMFFRFGR